MSPLPEAREPVLFKSSNPINTKYIQLTFIFFNYSAYSKAIHSLGCTSVAQETSNHTGVNTSLVNRGEHPIKQRRTLHPADISRAPYPARRTEGLGQKAPVTSS